MIKYQLLLACFRSGQMSSAQMQEHIKEDVNFAAYAKKHMRA